MKRLNCLLVGFYPAEGVSDESKTHTNNTRHHIPHSITSFPFSGTNKTNSGHIQRNTHSQKHKHTNTHILSRVRTFVLRPHSDATRHMGFKLGLGERRSPKYLRNAFAGQMFCHQQRVRERKQYLVRPPDDHLSFKGHRPPAAAAAAPSVARTIPSFLKSPQGVIAIGIALQSIFHFRNIAEWSVREKRCFCKFEFLF